VVAVAYQPGTWAARIVTSRASEVSRERDREPWVDLDRQLRAVARRRAALDHEELTLIREAIRVQLWRPLGMTSMREYMEQVMGYSPHVASERLRVADALDALTAFDEALATGELSYSAVRELTRIATRKTEDAWLEAAHGKNLRQIEELVAEREPGDAPDDAPKPDIRPRRRSMLLRPAADAILLTARKMIEDARGERIDESDLIEEMGRLAIAALSGATATSTAPRAQIARITRCDACGQAHHHAAGRKIAITQAEYETAACDALMIGSLDAAPERASSTIPPATRRFVLHRDGDRCTVPGCRASRNLDCHHIKPREQGGGHEPENLTTLCAGHHAALHRGELVIEGKAPAIKVTRRWQSHVGRARLESHVGRTDRESHVERTDLEGEAVLALTTLGFKKPAALRAVQSARDQLAADAPLEAVLRAALRECPR
jgi:Holliday junction resolvase RuvA-like protein/HNH endonuclease